MSETKPTGGNDHGNASTSGDAHDVEERFQTLESKLLYQDRTVDELNAVVIRQQDQIDLLIAETRRLRDLLENAGGGVVETGEEPPPPHY